MSGRWLAGAGLGLTLLVGLSLLFFRKPDDGKEREPPSFDDRLRGAVERGFRFFRTRQAVDGGWYSEDYGALRDDPALTPFVLKVFLYGGTTAETRPAVRRAADNLSRYVTARGTIDEGRYGLAYPTYTAALAVLALSRLHDPEHLEARDAWLDYLLARQMTEARGWQPEDEAYGGWGYAPRLPDKGTVPADDANLSSTLFAIGALRLAGRGPEAPEIQKALRFVKRCQNHPGDGGFFMSPTGPSWNKAGEANGEFRSYGTMTADGLRALLACGLPLDHPRIRAAQRWLTDHFQSEAVPGTFPAGQRGASQGYLYYYLWSVSHALTRLPDPETRAWARQIATLLLKRQNPDGSWKNPRAEGREDDPLIATGFAMAALIHCQRKLQE